MLTIHDLKRGTACLEPAKMLANRRLQEGSKSCSKMQEENRGIGAANQNQRRLALTFCLNVKLFTSTNVIKIRNSTHSGAWTCRDSDVGQGKGWGNRAIKGAFRGRWRYLHWPGQGLLRFL
jgi:hypothetical protein